jgi:plastocyanin
VILMELISPPGRAAYFTPRSEQITGPDGTYAFSVYGGTYRLRAEKPGYQTYTSPSVEVDGIWPGRDILLTPRTQVAAAAQAASYQVHMTDDGFELAELAVRPGSTVEFVNLDLDEHTATGEGWDSGVLGPGERFKLLVGTAGAFPYSDAVELLNRGRILVAPNAPPTGNHIRLPLIRR